ncbi:MAG: hypothetical protein GX627_02450 [Parcubacteria group bacterium]|nr:hypothetical protein [Parcubacteria group bacterium]
MDWKKYTYTFFITVIIFITAIFASNYFNQKKINEIKNIESQISIDISASETQFSLLSELSCKDISSEFLSKELATLGDKLSYTEESRGSDNAEVINLKKYYSLLQIKDFILMQKINERCGGKHLFIMYFYSNIENDCKDCEKEGYVLTRLRQDYPELRVYSFDYNLQLSALQTLISIYKIEDKQPALLIDDKVYYGFKSIDEIKDVIPALKEIDKQKNIKKASDKASTTER